MKGTGAYLFTVYLLPGTLRYLSPSYARSFTFTVLTKLGAARLSGASAMLFTYTLMKGALGILFSELPVIMVSASLLLSPYLQGTRFNLGVPSAFVPTLTEKLLNALITCSLYCLIWAEKK
jgi:hypothetical protein